MFKKVFYLIFSSIIILACSSKDSPNPVDSSDRVAMLTNEGNNVIVPSFQALSANANGLVNAANGFAAETGNEEKLKSLQSAWLIAATSWKTASLFTLGPVEDNFLSSGIYFTSTNYSGIEKEIAKTGVTFDNAYIESLGAALKGLPAIEYMIYSSAGNSTVTGGYTGTNGAQRISYLKALCVNLQTQAAKIVAAWEPGYVKTFIEKDGRDINSSLGVLSNKMIDLIYTIKDERLGAPLGKRNSGTAQPDLVDGRISNESLKLLNGELQSLENAFTGKGIAGVDRAGFDDILDAVDAKSEGVLLSTKIKNQFALVHTKLNLISVPLSIAVTTQTAAVGSAYDELRRLQVMMEVDMINNLGVLLTFSDNDGD